jgi:hypothetical protein
VVQLQRGLIQYHRSFLWEGPRHEALAYATAIGALERRLLIQRGLYLEPAVRLEEYIPRIPTVDQS